MDYAELLARLDDLEFLDDQHVQALNVHGERLQLALRADDAGLAIGTAKDLVESVAKVVCSVFGVAFGDGDDLPQLSVRCHEILQAHPRAHQDRGALQRLTSAVMQIPQHLAALRNGEGAGHGHAFVTDIFNHSVVLTSEAAVLWSYWVLAASRLRLQEEEQFRQHVAEIEGGRAFRRGELRAHLVDAIGLQLLDHERQRACGVACGRRRVRGTFVVGLDVINPFIDGEVEWPDPFLLGLLEGLLLDASGRGASISMPTVISGLVRHLWSSCEDEVRALVQRVCSADIARAFDLDARTQWTALLGEVVGQLDEPEICMELSRLMDHFAPTLDEP